MLIEEAARTKKAEEPIILDVRKIATICDYFFICSGSSIKKTQAIADGIIESLKKKKVLPWHTEGYREGKWVVLDYNTVIAHIFYTETRTFYNLERLWGDAPILKPHRSKKSRKCGSPQSSVINLSPRI